MAKSKAKIYFGGIEKIKARIKLIASGSVIHGLNNTCSEREGQNRLLHRKPFQKLGGKIPFSKIFVTH